LGLGLSIPAMDSRPIVTYAGDTAVFTAIEPGLVGGLPTESVEWKRSYGRPSKLTSIECTFSPFDVETLERTRERLEGQPVFHTYWTHVQDLDTYKQGLKEDIQAWQHSIKASGVASDWIVVVVEPPDSKKVNKFPLRTTVLEKLKQDVGGKTPDKCLAVIDPSKSGESKAAESMQALLHKFRLFFLQSFNKVLNRFEENIRAQRERRTEPKWNFCQYFLLQEELAFVYETMDLHEESLIQYDELDALLTQFVLNCAVGDIPDWLAHFEKSPSDWAGPSLDRNLNMRLQSRLAGQTPSLLDMRNYLFSRQSCLLLQCGKPWEVARRSLSFLHNTLQELDILETERGLPGSASCWVLLTCLEVTGACAAHTEAGEKCNLYTADLWSYAKEKLHHLGSLCGLLPGRTPSSEQLHLMVSLTSGMAEDRYRSGDHQLRNPLDRLKESLSSNQAFKKNYLEMCEIAISSYKHIGRIRSARLIGKDLASFYLDLGEVQKAASFLAEGLKTFLSERWNDLAGKTMLDLARCYSDLGEKEKYVRICAQIASLETATMENRIHYFHEMMKTLVGLENTEKILIHADDSLDLVSCNVDKSNVEEQLIPGKEVCFSVVLTSRLPLPLTATSLEVSVTKEESPPAPPSTETTQGERQRGSGKRGSGLQRSPSGASSTLSSGLGNNNLQDEGEGEVEELEDGRLDIIEQLDYKQDKSLCAARLVCRNSNMVLRRKDSSGSILKELGQLKKTSSTMSLLAENVEIHPGTRTYQLKTVMEEEGKYNLTQLSVVLRQLDFLTDLPGLKSSFTVTSMKPAVVLNRSGSELFAGLENMMVLSVHTGSYHVKEGTLVSLSCSRGMRLRAVAGSVAATQAMVPLPQGEPFTTVTANVVVVADLVNQKDSSSIEHKVTIRDPWSPKETEIYVHFIPAFYSSFQLQTAMDKKFLQILIYPLAECNFHLTNHSLNLLETPWEGLKLNSLNMDEELVANNQCEAGYLWQLVMEGDIGSQVDRPVKGRFTLDYSPSCGPSAAYEATFQFQDFLTLYTVQAKVEPAKGNEFCRAGTLCPLSVQLNQCNSTTFTSLYYEVIADQAVWAVCGRQGAVVSLEESAKQIVVIDVMPLVGGHLPLPAIRLSKYIPADTKSGAGGGLGGARLDPFATGQVYNMSRSQQIHVLPPLNQHADFVSLP